MSGDPSQARPWHALALLLVLSTLLKLALLVPAARLPLRADERQYVTGAIAIAKTGVPAYTNPNWDEAHSSPLYPYALGAVCLVVGEEHLASAARVLQVLASTLTAWLVFVVAARVFERRIALASAAIVALGPTFVGYTHWFYTETLYTLLFVGLAAVLLGGERPISYRRALAAGLVAGLAALTRGAFVVQAPFVLAWLLLAGDAAPRRRALTALAFALGMTATIAPWTIRNAVRYQRFLLIDTNGGNVLYKNWNAIDQENHDVGLERRWQKEQESYHGAIPLRPRVESDDPLARNSAEIEAAVQFTLAHPLLYAEQSLVRAAEFVNPTSFLVRSIRYGDYDVSPAVAELVVWSVLLGTMALLAFGAFGLAARPDGAPAALLVLLMLSNVAVCVAIVSMSRYRLPMMPLLAPFAVHGLVSLRRLPAERPRAFTLALALVVAMAVAWVRYVPYSL